MSSNEKPSEEKSKKTVQKTGKRDTHPTNHRDLSPSRAVSSHKPAALSPTRAASSPKPTKTTTTETKSTSTHPGYRLTLLPKTLADNYPDLTVVNKKWHTDNANFGRVLFVTVNHPFILLLLFVWLMNEFFCFRTSCHRNWCFELADCTFSFTVKWRTTNRNFV
jgi:hypothetical protein